MNTDGIKSHKKVRLLCGRKKEDKPEERRAIAYLLNKTVVTKAPLARVLISVITKSLSLYTMSGVNSPLCIPTRTWLPCFDSGEVRDIMWRLLVRLL